MLQEAAFPVLLPERSSPVGTDLVRELSSAWAYLLPGFCVLCFSGFAEPRVRTWAYWWLLDHEELRIYWSAYAVAKAALKEP